MDGNAGGSFAGGSFAGGEIVLARESAPALRGLGALARRAREHEAFDGEGIQRWLDFEDRALLLGLDPDLSAANLARLGAAGGAAVSAAPLVGEAA